MKKSLSFLCPSIVVSIGVLNYLRPVLQELSDNLVYASPHIELPILEILNLVAVSALGWFLALTGFRVASGRMERGVGMVAITLCTLTVLATLAAGILNEGHRWSFGHEAPIRLKSEERYTFILPHEAGEAYINTWEGLPYPSTDLALSIGDQWTSFEVSANGIRYSFSQGEDGNEVSYFDSDRDGLIDTRVITKDSQETYYRGEMIWTEVNRANEDAEKET
jgi:hypothetical protein